MSLRRQLHSLRQRHNGPPSVIRLRKLLNERMRRPGHQRQLHVVPIFANRVVHDGPTLQQRLLLRLRRQHKSICCFPDRHFADVAHVQIAFTRARRRNCHPPQILVARRSDQAKVSPHFHLQILFGNSNASGRGHLRGAYFTAVANQRNFRPPGRFFVFLARLLFDAQKFSRHGGTGAAAHFQPSSSQRTEKIRYRRIFAERQTERGQPPGQRRFRVVIDSGYFAAGQIENRQRLQHVIQLRAGEVDMHILAAPHMSQMFEITHAILVENHASHG